VNLLPPERNREAMDDDELIAAMAGGDDTALRELFARHAPWLAARLGPILPAGTFSHEMTGDRDDLPGPGQDRCPRPSHGLPPVLRRNVMNVEISDVTRRFGRTQAVAGVTLETGPGVFGLLGPNGAGKTTLLRMMATVIPPSSGRVHLLGRDPGGYGPRREIRRRLGYLPQNLGYYPGFTVAEFVEYFALLKEMPPGRVPQAVATAIERVDLGGRARAKLRTLSGGMLRRAGIAQAIVNEPELLLLDEPTAGLDPEQRVAFRVLLRDLGERATVIVSTHLVEDIGAACSEVALMDAGKIVFQGTPDELTARGEGTGAAGDAPLERGYSAVLAAARSATAAA
jgi:ABC-type multidrug transport system ATPase subunit